MNKKKIISIAIVLIIVIFVAWVILKKPVNQQPAGEQPTTSYEIQGMKIDVLKEGTGEACKNGDTVSVHYTGTLENGTKFDSSVDRGTPFEFTVGVGQVIKGWDLGVVGMKVGEKRKLTIPSDLGYGARGAGAMIPPNSTLIFDVELLGIKK